MGERTLSDSDHDTILALTRGNTLNGTPQVKSTKTTLLATDLKALAATPITCVPAVGGKILQFEGSVSKFNAGSETLVEPSAPDDPQFKYKDGSGAAVSGLLDAGSLITGTSDKYATAPPITVEGGVEADRINVPIVLHNTGAEWTGNASDDATLDVTVFYREVTP